MDGRSQKGMHMYPPPYLQKDNEKDARYGHASAGSETWKDGR